MHEELKTVVKMFREKKRNIEIVKTPDIFVDQHSTPREVQNWLKTKGFSEMICKQFRSMDGTDLFNLTKRQLEHHCGLAEGRRLNGQITLSRNASGYYTARTCELKRILDKARRKIEMDIIVESPQD